MSIRSSSVMAAVFLMAHSRAFSQCTSDIECKGERICVQGECVNPGETAQTDAEQSERTVGSGQESMGAVYVLIHPLGVLQFGPVAQVGVNVGHDMFVTAHYRYSALGLLSHVVAWAQDADELKMSSMGAGVGVVKFISSRRPHRFYAGGVCDLSWGGGRGDVDYPYDKWESETLTLAFAGNGGYRFRFGSGFFVGLGAFLGAGFETKHDWWYTGTNPNTRVQQGDKNVTPFIMLEASIGMEF